MREREAFIVSIPPSTITCKHAKVDIIGDRSPLPSPLSSPIVRIFSYQIQNLHKIKSITDRLISGLAGGDGDDDDLMR